MATIEEKQKELDALQTDFDEYIVSARELEEELDAELTKCREYYKFLYVNIRRVSGGGKYIPILHVAHTNDILIIHRNCNVDNLRIYNLRG